VLEGPTVLYAALDGTSVRAGGPVEPADEETIAEMLQGNKAMGLT